MHIVQDADIHNFLKRNLTYLEGEEAANNLILGMAIALSKNDKNHIPLLLLTIETDGKPQFCCLQTIPKNLIVYAHRPVEEKAVDLFLDYIQSKKLPIPDLIGPKSITADLASHWSERMQTPWHISMEQLIYRLDHVQSVRPCPGRFRKAENKDAAIVIPWIHQFLMEALGESPDGDAEKIALQKISDNQLYLWENGEVVSMAAITRPSRHGITVNFVFTPERHRRNGYATNCVARLSQLMLDGGYQFCSLFTDLKNPTSNKIYQRIGYRVVEEFQQIDFG